MTIIEVNSLNKTYSIKKGFFSTKKRLIHAVKGVSLSINEGEIMGLVGESGSGKSTLGRLMLGLERPTSGEIFFKGSYIWQDRGKRRIAPLIRKGAQMIFQDPSSSLNPKKTVFATLKEPIMLHGLSDKKGIKDKVVELLNEVGLDASFLHRYPHELSGGQKQRIGIARALSNRPSFIVCDEPTSALDVSIQAQIINLILDLKEKYNLTLLFISHALSLVNFISTRVAVMFRGELVEIMRPDETPSHPYTRLLMDAVKTRVSRIGNCMEQQYI